MNAPFALMGKRSQVEVEVVARVTVLRGRHFYSKNL